MKISGEYTFEAPQQAVWDALQDPTVLTSVLPGCERLEEVGENSYEGELNIRVGPVQGKFQGKIQMRDIEPPRRFTLSIDGRGAPGFVQATAAVDLEPSAGGTLIRYESDAQVGGRVASVGQRLLDSSAKSIIRQSLDGLHGLVKAKVAGDTAAVDSGVSATAGGSVTDPTTATPYEPPSQAEFAARVARDVARDLVPTPVWIVLGLLVAAVVLYLLLG